MTLLSNQNRDAVLITGVAGGIGSSCAQAFANAGWFVIGVDRKPERPIRGVSLYVQADAAKPDDIQNSLVLVKKNVGRLDALINNAALQITKPIMEMSIEEWDNIMNVNVRAGFLFAQAAFPLLSESRGSIVNVSSVHAVATSAQIAAYAASKGALMALTRALAVELAEHNIRVNAVLPGAVDTPMLRDGLNRGHVQGQGIAERMAELAAKTVNGRVGHPDEIAQCILFLANNDQSSFMTGQALIADGGATARLSTE
ncbi:MAG: SDR family oxidoreductase [Chloroflexota bacterium]